MGRGRRNSRQPGCRNVGAAGDTCCRIARQPSLLLLAAGRAQSVFRHRLLHVFRDLRLWRLGASDRRPAPRGPAAYGDGHRRRLGLYVLVAWLLAIAVQPFCAARATYNVIGRLPYLASCIFSCAAGIFDPLGIKLLLVSTIPAAFGGSSGMLWLDGMILSAAASFGN